MLECVTHFSTWSEMVNLTAVTTVVLIRAESDTNDSCNLGSKLAGSIRVSFPRHSATTFRVPSSPHSQCRNNCCQIAGTNGWSNCTPPGVEDWHVMICNMVSTSFSNEGCSKQQCSKSIAMPTKSCLAPDLCENLVNKVVSSLIILVSYLGFVNWYLYYQKTGNYF